MIREAKSESMVHKHWNCKTFMVKFLPAQVWQREFLSMTPWRGSIRPWSFGLPPSYVSGKRMPPSVTDIRRCTRKNKVTITAVDIKILIYNSYKLIHFYRGMPRMPQCCTALSFSMSFNNGQKNESTNFFTFLRSRISKNTFSVTLPLRNHMNTTTMEINFKRWGCFKFIIYAFYSAYVTPCMAMHIKKPRRFNQV
jgi:hypothetical protein